MRILGGIIVYLYSTRPQHFVFRLFMEETLIFFFEAVISNFIVVERASTKVKA